jgi:hypothetical protein
VFALAASSWSTVTSNRFATAVRVVSSAVIV